jgi:predicted Fe-S protein YdhL (DUF1289 family)
LSNKKPAASIDLVVIDDKREQSARMVHALVITGLLFHFKITELLLKCTYCVDGRLVADMEVACFEGGHLLTFGLAVALLLTFSLGYPLAALAMLCRAQREQGKQAKGQQPRRDLTRQLTIRRGRLIRLPDLKQATVRSSFAVLLDDIRQTYYWFHCVQFLHNWCLALLVTFNPAPDVKLFCIVMLDLVLITFVYLRRPFGTPEDNRKVLSVKGFAAVQSIVLLGAAMLLTLPIPLLDLPVWMEVPSSDEEGLLPAGTRTVIFAVLPCLWLLAFASFQPVRSVCRGCFRTTQEGVTNKGPHAAKTKQAMAPTLTLHLSPDQPSGSQLRSKSSSRSSIPREETTLKSILRSPSTAPKKTTDDGNHENYDKTKDNDKKKKALLLLKDNMRRETLGLVRDTEFKKVDGWIN